jgi:(hydroxyamino)benzene mutase
VRHPDDAEPVRASKATAAWWLGLLAAITGPLVAGLVPATVALALAAQFRREAHQAGGFLTGAARVRQGEVLAWSGVVLATAAVVAATVVGVLLWAGDPAVPRFPAHVD